MKSSLDIAREHELIPIDKLADRIGLLPDEVEPHGSYKAKISLSALDRFDAAADGKLVCVTGMTPTRGGEGNTTTTVSLTDGLARLGKRSIACLREASLGPVFGMRGGAAGGGRAQVVPMEELNLHFTGDIHAIGAANNLLAAMIDASVLHGNPHDIDTLRVPWRRAVDMNDRVLRKITIGLGGKANGYPRETGFDITAASEVMAITAIARNLRDLRQRLARITAGYSRADSKPGDGRGPARRRRDDRDAQGCAQAKPRADARGTARARPLRTARDDRSRQQLTGRGPRRHPARASTRSPSPGSERTWGWRSSSTSYAGWGT